MVRIGVGGGFGICGAVLASLIGFTSFCAPAVARITRWLTRKPA